MYHMYFLSHKAVDFETSCIYCLVCVFLRRRIVRFYLRVMLYKLLQHHHHPHSVFCLTTGPKPPLKRFLHIVRSRASSFKWEYPLLSLRSSTSVICLLPRLLVTSIFPFIFPSITCFRRQFLRKMWPIQLAYCNGKYRQLCVWYGAWDSY